MSTRYVLRVQVDPTDRADDVARRLLQLAESARAEEVCVFFFNLEFNDGHETPAQITEWIEWSRPWRQALRAAGVAVSLNPGHEIGHGDWHRSRKPGQDWQPLVDPAGREATVQVCPLDPDWQAYYTDSLHRYAVEDFDVIWVEDDIRLHNHAPLEWGGCFCPLHLGSFSDRTGISTSRDELVRACTAPGPPHPWRALWLDAWQESLLEVVESWRPIVAAHGCRLGLMSSRTETHAAEGRWWDRWWAAFDVVRPHFWGYSDVVPSALPDSIAQLEAQQRSLPAGMISYPEIENWPYWRWNKSYRQTAAQMSLAQILGCDGHALSLYDFPGNRPDDDPSRAEFLARWRPTLDWLSERFDRRLRAVGVSVPWSGETGRRVQLSDEMAGSWQSLVVRHGEWAPWLGALGTAFTSGEGRVTALSGAAVWAFDDQQLKRWLSGGVLLDGEAAHILATRGFGKTIGFADLRFRGEDAPVATLEVCTDPDFALWPGCKISVDFESYRRGTLVHGDPLPGARVISRLHDPRHRDVGHGALLYRNELGGRVATVPWNIRESVFMTPQRHHQLTMILDWLGSDAIRVHGGPWLVPQALTDGERWRVVIWNASPDETHAIDIHLPSGMPRPSTATQVLSGGTRATVPVDRGRLQLEQPLHQWEYVVLEVSE